jgi:hypothetical protein
MTDILVVLSLSEEGMNYLQDMHEPDKALRYNKNIQHWFKKLSGVY